VRSFPKLPPKRPASWYSSAPAAFAAGTTSGAALRKAGVHVDLAPVLDSSDGPLGPRHFRNSAFGLAFARGLAAGGAGACAKHFPGLGSTRVSTDKARVRGTVRGHELSAFGAAIRAGVPCVMVGHAVYGDLGRRPASLEPATYRLLRNMGFDGVAITDDLDVLGRSQAGRWARLAMQAGADLVLFTSGRDAGRAIDALVPLARRGQLDDKVERVLRLRRAYGL
jgi:beta-N-acetylhexosaminidase